MSTTRIIPPLGISCCLHHVAKVTRWCERTEAFSFSPLFFASDTGKIPLLPVTHYRKASVLAQRIVTIVTQHPVLVMTRTNNIFLAAVTLQWTSDFNVIMEVHKWHSTLIFDGWISGGNRWSVKWLTIELMNSWQDADNLKKLSSV